MNWLLKLLWFLYGQKVKLDIVQKAKRQGVVAYMRVLQGSRRVLIVALAGIVLIQTVMLAGFGALVTAFMLWNHDFDGKIEILFYLFLGLFVVPLALVAWLLSERTWYRISGAKKMVDEVLAARDSDAA